MVAPPTYNPQKEASYTFIDPLLETLNDFPIDWYELLLAQKEYEGSGQSSQVETSAIDFDMVDFRLEPGNRHPHLRKMLGTWLMGYPIRKWKEEVLPRLQQYNQENCDPPLSDTEVERLFVGIGKREQKRRAMIFDVEGVNKEKIQKEHHRERGEKTVICNEEINAIEIKDQPFVLFPYIPQRAITALTADTGAGKSLLMYILMHYIGKGRKRLVSLR